MNPSISNARKNLFNLVEQANNGEKVEFVHKGRVFQIVPVDQPSKLARIKPMNILPEGMTFEDLEQGMKDIREEGLLAWERNNPQ